LSTKDCISRKLTEQTNFSPQLIHIRKLSKSLDQLNKVNPCRTENFQNEEFPGKKDKCLHMLQNGNTMSTSLKPSFLTSDDKDVKAGGQDNETSEKLRSSSLRLPGGTRVNGMWLFKGQVHLPKKL
jgi:hypothetical protein